MALFLLTTAGICHAQTYANPILHCDWSDPDVCRVGEDYYMTASSFNFFPGLPILHSRDLVHWTQVGAALSDYPGDDESFKDGSFRNVVRHGEGVWAPAIRFHDGWFYIFCGDPDRGIFMVRTQDPSGPWEAPVWVVKERGFIDPCPFWDEDGKAYLSHALAGSRAGLKSVILVAPMSKDGSRLEGPSRVVYDGHLTQPTIEGTKMYKRDGYYYIFAPAGGVATGWQTVLRSESPFGPFEERIVLSSSENVQETPGTLFGRTVIPGRRHSRMTEMRSRREGNASALNVGEINGPHQGAWVSTPSGEDWFIHFQDNGAYGRIIHLQPMRWDSEGWPVIGDDPDGDGCGAPVPEYVLPSGGSEIAEDQVFCPYGLDPAWQYPCVPSPIWHMALPDGGVRLYGVLQSDAEASLWNCPNFLSRKFPFESFSVTAKLSFRPNPKAKDAAQQAGFAVMGSDYAALRLMDTPGGARLEYALCLDAPEGGSEEVRVLATLPYSFLGVEHSRQSRSVPELRYEDIPEASIWVRLEVESSPVRGNVPDARCSFSYSTDGRRFSKAGGTFTAKAGTWVGARFGFFCSRFAPSNDSGCLDITEITLSPGAP